METEIGTEALATKSELVSVKDEMIARLAGKSELAELKAAMFDMKAELMRWMFVFWVGQIAAVFAIIRYLK